MAEQALTSKEKGLLKVASKHKRTSAYLAHRLDDAEQIMLDMLKHDLTSGVAYRSSLIWQYVSKHEIHWYGDSSKLQVVTVIETYAPKRGEPYLAHFTQNRNYLCRVTEKDSVPRPYMGWFSITPEKFVMTATGNESHLWQLFAPKPVPIKMRRPKLAKPAE